MTTSSESSDCNVVDQQTGNIAGQHDHAARHMTTSSESSDCNVVDQQAGNIAGQHDHAARHMTTSSESDGAAASSTLCAADVVEMTSQRHVGL